LRRKGLKLSLEKSKIMVFEKERDGMKKKAWKWGEEDKGFQRNKILHIID